MNRATDSPIPHPQVTEAREMLIQIGFDPFGVWTNTRIPVLDAILIHTQDATGGGLPAAGVR